MADAGPRCRAGILAGSIPSQEALEQVALFDSAPRQEALGETDRHRRIVGPGARPSAVHAARRIVGHAWIAVPFPSLERSPQRIAHCEPQESAHRPIEQWIGHAILAYSGHRRRGQPNSCHAPTQSGHGNENIEYAFRAEAAMDYPDYLRARAAEFRAQAQEVEEAAVARELQELATVCEHVAEELEDRQTAG